MRFIYSPENEMDLALIKCALEAFEIPYFVMNDKFGSFKIGPRIFLYNTKYIGVPESCEQEAMEIIEAYRFRENEDRKTSTGSYYSLRDKVRIALEFIAFSWFVPKR